MHLSYRYIEYTFSKCDSCGDKDVKKYDIILCCTKCNKKICFGCFNNVQCSGLLGAKKYFRANRMIICVKNKDLKYV